MYNCLLTVILTLFYFQLPLVLHLVFQFPSMVVKNAPQKSGASGYNCTVTCNAGYYFYDYPDQSSVTFDCNANTNIWDKPIIPACTIGKIIVICYIIIQSNLPMHSPVLKGHLYLVLS